MGAGLDVGHRGVDLLPVRIGMAPEGNMLSAFESEIHPSHKLMVCTRVVSSSLSEVVISPPTKTLCKKHIGLQVFIDCDSFFLLYSFLALNKTEMGSIFAFFALSLISPSVCIVISSVCSTICSITNPAFAKALT